MLLSSVMNALRYLPNLHRARQAKRKAKERIEHLLHMHWLEKMRIAGADQASDPMIAETVRLYWRHVKGS